MKIPVFIKTSEGTQPGTVVVRRLNQEERTKRAIRALAIGFVLTVGSIIVPILHFILVPGFFIATPIFAFYLYKQKDMIISGQGICPKCGKPFTIVSGPEVWPFADVCASCFAHVIIEKS